MKIGIFGGSFDPPHIGHCMVVTYVLSCFDVDKIWLIPLWKHPLSKPVSPYEKRKKMVKLSMKIFGKFVEVHDVEKEIGGFSWTIKTIEHLKKKYPDYKFSFIIGSDILSEKHLWKDFDKIEKMVEIIVLKRGGFPNTNSIEKEIEIPEISSSEIRNMIKEKKNVSPFISKDVLKYINDNNLYR